MNLKRLFQYTETVGLRDDVGKRFNWRNLENTNITVFYGTPIYREMTYIGKITSTAENECIRGSYLPERYIYSINTKYDLGINNNVKHG